MSFDPQAAELSRALYEESPMSVREIAALHGVSERSVYRYAARHNWRPRRTRLAIWQQSFRPEMPAEKARMKRRTKPAAAPAEETRRALVARLWRAAARHVSAIEKRLAKSTDGNAAQTDIASIASLSRSMQQLALLGALLTLFAQGRARWTPRDYAALAREGHQRNAIAYRCVRTIAEAVADLPLGLTDGARELDAHPLLDLLAHPNSRETRAGLIEKAAGILRVAGDSYLELVSVAGSPRELHALRPDRMKLVPGAEGWPDAYEYSVGGRTLRFDMRERPAPILHLTLFHPLDDHYGLSPLEAAGCAVDVHNAACAWNKALLDNAARPSGALVYSAGAGNLSEEQFERLRTELDENYRGARNAGRPLLLEGGLDWKSLSLTPKDMDFIEAKHSSAREIALAFGVPPMLLGIPGDNTYSNYAEANRALYRQTVLPLAGRLFDALTNWLAPAFGEGLRLVPDLDQVSALAAGRESLWKRVNEATFLTDDERRAAVGYAPRA